MTLWSLRYEYRIDNDEIVDIRIIKRIECERRDEQHYWIRRDGREDRIKLDTRYQYFDTFTSLKQSILAEHDRNMTVHYIGYQRAFRARGLDLSLREKNYD